MARSHHREIDDVCYLLCEDGTLVRSRDSKRLGTFGRSDPTAGYWFSKTPAGYCTSNHKTRLAAIRWLIAREA